MNNLLQSWIKFFQNYGLHLTFVTVFCDILGLFSFHVAVRFSGSSLYWYHRSCGMWSCRCVKLSRSDSYSRSSSKSCSDSSSSCSWSEYSLKCFGRDLGVSKLFKMWGILLYVCLSCLFYYYYTPCHGWYYQSNLLQHSHWMLTYIYIIQITR